MENKERLLWNLVSELRYQYPAGVSTVGRCKNACGRIARGSGACANCIEKEIAELTGMPIAAEELHVSIRRYRDITSEMVESLSDG